jgi:hypothetical protein
MIKLSNKLLLALICFIFSIGVFTSCKKSNDVVDNGKAQLFSFGPTGARPLDTIRFIGTHLDRVTSIQFIGTNAVVDQKAFIQQSSDLILVIVPKTTEKGYLTLKTPDGDIITKTMLNLKVAAVETTMTAQARPGENITITGDYLNWVTKVTFADKKEVTTFVSKSVSQLVITVPTDAQTGALILTYKGTDTGDVVTKDILKITLPVATSFSPIPVKPADNVTITGTDLDLVKQIIFTGASTPVASAAFVSQSATQIVVKVPVSAQTGKLTLVAASGVQIVSTADLAIVPLLLPLADFTMPIYTDALQNNFQDWSYTDIHDFNSTANVRQGTKSIKAVYGGNGYQGLTFHNGSTGISTAGYTTLEFSVFGDVGTGGKKLQIITNGNYGGSAPQVTIVEGKWTTYSILLSTMGTFTTISEIVLQGSGFTGTVYIDHVGLR